LADQILFEHPLNEKCRTLLRLSHLFEQFEHHLGIDSEWNSRAALFALLDIAAVLARADIKSELIKESERHASGLRKMANNPGVDNARLEQILHDVQTVNRTIQLVAGQLGQALRKNEFLNAVVQRSSIPGGSFDFDLPQLHWWLQQDPAKRVTQLKEWHAEVAPVQEAVDLLLTMIRNSAVPRHEHAIAGLYQHSVSGSNLAQMVRVAVPRDAGLFAEISGSKHRFNVRFLETSDLEHPSQTQLDVAFYLTTCFL
jgi:cell division protein ZapD